MKKKIPNDTKWIQKNPITKKKKYNCDVCDYFTSNRKDFLKHCSTKKHDTKWVHQNNENYKYFRCSHCDYISGNFYEFESHLEEFSHGNLSRVVGTNLLHLEHMEKPFVCNFGCGKSFSQIGNRNKHH